MKRITGIIVLLLIFASCEEETVSVKPLIPDEESKNQHLAVSNGEEIFIYQANGDLIYRFSPLTNGLITAFSFNNRGDRLLVLSKEGLLVLGSYNDGEFLSMDSYMAGSDVTTIGWLPDQERGFFIRSGETLINTMPYDPEPYFDIANSELRFSEVSAMDISTIGHIALKLESNTSHNNDEGLAILDSAGKIVYHYSTRPNAFRLRWGPDGNRLHTGFSVIEYEGILNDSLRFSLPLSLNIGSNPLSFHNSLTLNAPATEVFYFSVGHIFENFTVDVEDNRRVRMLNLDFTMPYSNELFYAQWKY